MVPYEAMNPLQRDEYLPPRPSGPQPYPVAEGTHRESEARQGCPPWHAHIGSTQPASGSVAMIDEVTAFQQVPWQPVLDKRIGQHIGGVMRNVGGIAWSSAGNKGGACECWQGAVISAENITCLSPWGRTGDIRSRLARIARPRFAASGLDRTSPDPAGARHTGKAN
jgi:hypothetical protein